MICCVVPRELEGKLRGRLGRALAETGMRVIVEGREADRRDGDRRAGPSVRDRIVERRRTRGSAGRRIGDRRAVAVPVPPPDLPRRARRLAARLTFVTPLAPAADYQSDAEAARAVLRAQLGEDDAIRDLFLGWFDAVYGCARVALRTGSDAEALTQEAFGDAFAALHLLDPKEMPFRAFLFDHVIAAIHRHEADTFSVSSETRENVPLVDDDDEAIRAALAWVRDHEIAFLIGRLPAAQRDVLLLRHLGRLSESHVAELLGLETRDQRALHADALDRLRETLEALGRGAPSTHREAMRRLSRPSTVIVRRRQALLAP
jgi:RNA polymerase sigma factor (sigma-70 family)